MFGSSETPIADCQAFVPFALRRLGSSRFASACRASPLFSDPQFLAMNLRLPRAPLALLATPPPLFSPSLLPRLLGVWCTLDVHRHCHRTRFRFLQSWRYLLISLIRKRGGGGGWWAGAKGVVYPTLRHHTHTHSHHPLTFTKQQTHTPHVFPIRTRKAYV